MTYTEPSVIIHGQPEGLEDVPVRVHDACFTSEVGAGRGASWWLFCVLLSVAL